MIYDGSFDETVDVIVVGFGFGGAATAIEAHDRGARVLVIEKMPHPGGISICAGGGTRCATEERGALEYLKATTARTTPENVLREFVRGTLELESWFRSLARVNGAEIALRDRQANYPFPGSESFQFLLVKSVPGFDAAKEYPHVHGARDGVTVFKLLHDNVKARGIEVRYACAAERILTDRNGEVRGLLVNSDRKCIALAARRAVVLACGGFEADYEMQRQTWRIRIAQTVATRANTGDGIRMAQELGAGLWHMWNFHGSYGFRSPDPSSPFAIRVKGLPDWTPCDGPHDEEWRDWRTSSAPRPQMSWILVGRDGRRFMNEYPPYLQDTGHRPFDVFDTVKLRFQNQPAYLIVDDDGRKLYPLGHQTFNDAACRPYHWSEDNLREVETGLLKRAESIEDLARIIGADRATLGASVQRWNQFCAEGADAEFGRPPASMMPLAKPPFFIGEVWPVVSNTQGGPVHDERQRVLNSFGDPIPGLYEAGELGSIWGHLYLGGSNLAECFVTGRIAGREAAQRGSAHQQLTISLAPNTIQNAV
ncbi:MAG: FAD-binding protein [Betaproteobacteria bacterium]|nr:FAD-binding protein [Betaproteobacteria bacterium]